MFRKLFGSLAIAAMLLGPAARMAAQESTPWIHIHVHEQGEKASKVQVNLPLALVQTAATLMPDEVGRHIKKGRLQLKNHHISVADLRRLWSELRLAGDAEFVTVEEKDQRVRIARQGDRIQIHVEEGSADHSNVRVKVPVDVVDALLEGEGPELNLEAAIASLKNKRGHLIQVDDGDTQVRIWIDERS